VFAAALCRKAGADVMADLDLFGVVYTLQCQAAVADELAS
jgi:hypothetical protein